MDRETDMHTQRTYLKELATQKKENGSTIRTRMAQVEDTTKIYDTDL